MPRTSTTGSRLAYPLVITMGSTGWASRIWTCISMPSASGRCRSMTTTSGKNVLEPLQRVGAGAGEGQVVALLEVATVRAPERDFVLDEQDPTPDTGGWHVGLLKLNGHRSVSNWPSSLAMRNSSQNGGATPPSRTGCPRPRAAQRPRLRPRKRTEARRRTGLRSRLTPSVAYSLVTLAAWRPFGPSRTSNSTWSFSFNDRKPSAWMAE